jgi:AMMECR1 domain-containing protein
LPGGAWKGKDATIEIFSALVFNEKSLELDDNSDADLETN